VEVLLLRQAEDLWITRCLHFLTREGYPRATLFREENGKPGLRDAGPWHCNASTTRGESLLALAMFRIGVDWENLARPVSATRIARRYFSGAEETWMKANPGEERFRFFQLWTAKEAAVKLDGCGLYGGGLCDSRINIVDDQPACAWLGGRQIFLQQQQTSDGFFLTVAAYCDFQLAKPPQLPNV
jgi:phosphopantetheinyl transferase